MRTRAIILPLVIALVCIPLVSAGPGVGIIWENTPQDIYESRQTCLTIKAFNIADQDVNVHLGISDSLKNIPVVVDAKNQTIPAFTDHTGALPVQLCLTLGNMYGNCNDTEKQYTGKLLALDDDGTTLGSSLPLTLVARCTPMSHINPWIFIGGGAIIVLLAVIIYIIVHLTHPQTAPSKKRRRR